MRRVALILPLMAMACSGGTQPTADNVTAPVDRTVTAPNSAGPARMPVPAPSPVVATAPTRPIPPGGEPAVPEPGAPLPTTSLPEGPFTPDSAQGGANVVQTYFALIGEGKYRQAYRLWDDRGHASGLSADAFVASFDKYRSYRANVGGPGPIDAGAGQRYVTVPVRVTGTLKAGDRPFVLDGPITLHRTADIDGATAEQKSWRISTSGLKPRPDLSDQRPR